VYLRDGGVTAAALRLPPGAPDRPLSTDEVHDKLAACGEDVPHLLDGVDWPAAEKLFRQALGGRPSHPSRRRSGRAR
jgi:hypothetical protein